MVARTCIYFGLNRSSHPLEAELIMLGFACNCCKCAPSVVMYNKTLSSKSFELCTIALQQHIVKKALGIYTMALNGGSSRHATPLPLFLCALGSFGSRQYCLLLEQLRKLAVLVHRDQDVAAADELLVDVQLGDCWPVRVLLDACHPSPVSTLPMPGRPTTKCLIKLG